MQAGKKVYKNRLLEVMNDEVIDRVRVGSTSTPLMRHWIANTYWKYVLS